MDKLTSMAVFARVVETKSFSAAARQMGVSKSAVSKQINRLEEYLGTTLISRTTRRLNLTDTGAAYYEYCARVIAEVEEAESAVARLHEEPRGRLRVNAPMTFGRLHIAPALSEFLAKYPELNLDLSLNDAYIDILQGGFDLSVRITRSPDHDLVAEKLTSSRTVVCASPEYLMRQGEPQAPADLSEHNCLHYTLHSAGREWPFLEGGEVRSVRVSGDLETNNGSVLRSAVLDGLGITMLPTFIIGDDLRAGRLRTVLPGYRIPEFSVYAVYPQSRHLSPKVRVFIEFLKARFGPTPYWDAKSDAEPETNGPSSDSQGPWPIAAS